MIAVLMNQEVREEETKNMSRSCQVKLKCPPFAVVALELEAADRASCTLARDFGSSSEGAETASAPIQPAANDIDGITCQSRDRITLDVVDFASSVSSSFTSLHL